METVYFAHISYGRDTVNWTIKEVKVLEETSLHLIVQGGAGNTFLILKESLDKIDRCYHTTRQNALAHIKHSIEENLKDCKLAIQNYQELLYDLEREM